RPGCSCAVGRTRGPAAARAADAGLMRAAAFFDLDGTLLPETSTERVFLRRAVATGALSPLRLAWGGARAAFSFATRRSTTVFEHKAYLAGLDVRRVEALGVDCVHAEVLPRLRADLVAEMERARARGELVILLSGTLDFLGTPIANALQCDASRFAELER